MERWKVFFNVGGVLAAMGATFLVLGLSRDILPFVVLGATHFIVGCSLGWVGLGQKSRSAAGGQGCSR